MALTGWLRGPTVRRSVPPARDVAPNAGQHVLAGGVGDEGGDDVGGVPVKRLAAPVITHRRSRVGVTGRFLDVAQRYAGIQGRGDERVPQGVRPDPLADLSSAGDAPHDPPRGVAVQPLPSGIDEDRSVEPFTHGEIDGPGDLRGQRHRDQLAALAQHGQGAVPAFLAQRFDVGADRLGHPQPVLRQQRHQGVVAWRRQTSGDKIAPSSLRSKGETCDS
jgi:hypothetical protein